MKTIWKFTIKHLDAEIVLRMSNGAEILTVQVQHNQICIWAIVDPSAPLVQRYFYITGTGHPLRENITKYKYIGTFQLNNGALVLHLFEDKNYAY